MTQFFWLIKYYLINRFIHGLKIKSPPVFITGCEHSGTSLLLAIMGSHSRIHPVPFESKIGYKTLKKFFYRWRFNIETIAHAKSRWIEKTPRHIYCVDNLLALAPGVKIILLVRDGRDVACSFKERFGDAGKGIDAWVRANLAGRRYRSHPLVMTVKYEELIDRPEQILKNICAFLGEEYEPALLDYYKKPKYFYARTIKKPTTVSGKGHDQYRNWQINQPLFDGRGKWQTLTELEKKLIKESANDLLTELGYITSPNW